MTDTLQELIVPSPHTAVPTAHERHFLQRLLKVKNVVIFSPHLDDALLSMGSVLELFAAHNIPVHIFNIFTKGSEVKTELNIRLLKQASVRTFDEYFVKRKAEDRMVISTVDDSIKITNLDHVDAAWRANSKGEILYEKVLGSIHSSDEPFIKTLTNQLQGLVGKNSDTLVFAPLGVGSHADHLIVRNAASGLEHDVIYYKDFPYSNLYDKDNQFVTAKNLTGVTCYEGDYTKKKERILMYETQRISILKTENLTMTYETFYVTSDFLAV